MDEQVSNLDSDQLIPRRKSTAPCPLSFAQERLWFLDQYEPNSPLYNVPVRLCLRGVLNMEALEDSLSSLVARHESLRTTFNATDGDPRQVSGESRPFDLQTVDLRKFPPEKREAELRRVYSELAQRPFNLSADLMIRAALVQLRTTEYDLLLTLHHIAFDGWSLGVLFRELTEYYRAYSTGSAPNLPELPIQYADFAIWQRQWLQGKVLEGELAYWTKQLAGNLEFEQFPIGHPRPPRQTYHGGREVLCLSAELTESLKALGRREGGTLFMILLAAFQILLRRYTGHHDVLVGSVIANRNRMELEGLIGFFVNTLVIRTDFSGNPTFRELLARVRATTLDAYDHQDLPFEKLVEVLQPERTLTHGPLCQVVFVYEDAPPAPVELPGLSLAVAHDEDDMAKFDLTVTIQWREGLRVSFRYNTDLFEAASIRQALCHYRRLLEAIVADPERPVDKLPMLTEEERRRLLVEWNATRREYPELCVHELFEMQAERSPEATALAFEEWRLSYRELNQRANRLARHLRALGIGPEATVGVCLEGSPEAIVSLLGILKAGGAYVPLDPTYPRERLSFMIRDAGARVVLTITRWLDRLPSEGTTTICLDNLPESVAPDEFENITAGVKPDNLAYIIYTSGSTGVPKGVEVCHRGIVRLLVGVDYVHLTTQEVFLQMARLAFDVSTFEIWGALLHGATLVLFPGPVPAAQELGEVLRGQKVTTLWLTSSFFNAVIDEAPAVLSPVRQLLVGGEALSAPHVRLALSALPDTQLINGYGPTESTTFACCYSIPRRLKEDASSIPISRPISNTQVYILDTQMEPVPIGTVGELHIAGDGLARGYLNRPDLTGEKFVANPFSGRPGDRLYKTGDLARYLPDGNIEFRGRLDDQIKIRGYRIEPGEIEAVLAQHPAVKTAAVIAGQIQSNEKSLVAYVVPKEDQALTVEGLQTFLKQKLPQYMVPGRFMFVATLPLTPRGKLDCHALPAPEAVDLAFHPRFVVPRDEVESKLLEIWQTVLKHQPISVTDNFFDLGGHSLSATKLLVRIEKTFGQRLSIASLFQAPTVEQLATLLRDESRQTLSLHVAPIQPGGSRPPFFCIGAGPLFRSLARHLGSEQPFLGLGLGEAEVRELPTPFRLEDIAASLIKILRHRQPRGPYFLGGWCMDGVIAYETALQLQAQGDEVALLVLFDAANPGTLKEFSKLQLLKVQPFLLIQKWKFRLANLRQATLKQAVAYVRQSLRLRLDLLSYKIWEVNYRFHLRVGRRIEGGLRDFEKISLHTMFNYRPKPYPGRAVLIRAESRPKGRFRDDTFGWSPLLAGEFEVHFIPGGHNDMFQEPGVETLAKTLKACLDAAQETSPGNYRRGGFSI